MGKFLLRATGHRKTRFTKSVVRLKAEIYYGISITNTEHNFNGGRM